MAEETSDDPGPRPSLMLRMLDVVERVGNKLPHPFWLFCILILAVVAVSEVLYRVAVATPETQIL